MQFSCEGLGDAVFTAVIVVPWLMGIVLAKGGWLTALSVFCPFYAWYLVVERVMILTGFGT